MHILLGGAVAMLFAAPVLAWIATFAKLVPLQPVEVLVKDYGALISAHIDFLLMSLLCMALWSLRIPLAHIDCWLIVTGGLHQSWPVYPEGVSPRNVGHPVPHNLPAPELRHDHDRLQLGRLFDFARPVKPPAA